MSVQIINPTDSDFSASQFLIDEDAEESNELTWVPLGCCDYSGGFYSVYDAPIANE